MNDYLATEVGELASEVRGEDALFGTTPYMDVIHRMQLESVNAEISFAAPLKTSAVLPAGKVYVRDLFKFCPFYQPSLYSMQLTGREIRGYLEYSYAGWVATSITEDGGLIRLRTGAQPTDKYKTSYRPTTTAQHKALTIPSTSPSLRASV